MKKNDKSFQERYEEAKAFQNTPEGKRQKKIGIVIGVMFPFVLFGILFSVNAGYDTIKNVMAGISFFGVLLIVITSMIVKNKMK